MKLDDLLKRGLRNAPVPEASAGFDARVRAGLRRPEPWWQRLWRNLTPGPSPGRRGEKWAPDLAPLQSEQSGAGAQTSSPSRRGQGDIPLWSAVRYTLAPAAFSLAVTLAALIAVGVPKPGDAARPKAAGNIALVPRPDRLRSIEQALDRLDNETPSLGAFSESATPLAPRRTPTRSPMTGTLQ